MHYPDLATRCDLASGPAVRAVGWLTKGHEFACGPLDERVAKATERLAADGWVHVYAAGFHECDLCHGARESRNILVPGEDVLYCAPAMVTHYMRDHGYLPPAEFSASVLACPEPQSDAYFGELRRFADVLSMTPVQFDRYVARRRAQRAKAAEAAAVEATRKRFTWD